MRLIDDVSFWCLLGSCGIWRGVCSADMVHRQGRAAVHRRVPAGPDRRRRRHGRHHSRRSAILRRVRWLHTKFSKKKCIPLILWIYLIDRSLDCKNYHWQDHRSSSDCDRAVLRAVGQKRGEEEQEQSAGPVIGAGRRRRRHQEASARARTCISQRRRSCSHWWTGMTIDRAEGRSSPVICMMMLELENICWCQWLYFS